MNSYINSDFLCLFTEDDRIEGTTTDEEWEEQIKVMYKSTVKIIKKRLDIMWFNLKTLEYYFNKKKNQDDDNSELLNGFTFDDYLSKLQKIYDNNIFLFWDDFNHEKRNELEQEDKYIKYILNDMEISDPRIDIDSRYYLRGFLERINEDIEIKVDLSDLIEWGYHDVDEKFAENNLKVDDKIIIFAEGTTDIEFIKETMKLLYPEYVDFFTFLDIETSRLELWADRIVTYCKSLISAWIINKTIFIFDNDLAWHQAKDKLSEISSIPNNFNISTYPNLELARDYPTICPTWIENLDINWSACSLEMYFCEDLLKDDNKDFIPIQWKSFNEKYQKYQWALSDFDKWKVQKKFRERLQECKNDRLKIDNYNFGNMKLLLENIFSAFDTKVLI